jgi:predicted nucleic acid-binding protein
MSRLRRLLDISTLLAWLWKDHDQHGRVIKWQQGEKVAVCPITELGFLRISTQPAFGASMDEAREMLSDWKQRTKPVWVDCDISALDGKVTPTSSRTTDFYLANLADEWKMKWATLDEASNRPNTFVIPT